MLKLFLWLRYLRKRKIVLLSMGAVALSVGLLMVVAGLFGGFINAFEQSAVEVMGDVVIIPPVKIENCRSLIEELEKTEVVKAATALLLAKGLLHSGGGDVRAVSIWGIEPEKRAEVTGLKRSLLKAKKSNRQPSFEAGTEPEIIGGFVGIGVLGEPDERTDEYDLGAAEERIGREVVLTTGTAAEDKENRRFKRKVIKFTIADILVTGIYEIDRTAVYLPIKALQNRLYPERCGQLAHQIQIRLKNGADEDAALAQIRGVWEGFAAEKLGWAENLIRYTTIETSKQIQSRYIAELKKQMGVLLLIFGIVSMSVVLLIFCIFYMIVVTRVRDVAIIKSCGARSRSVAMVFIGFGAWIGIIGSAAGVGLGYVVTKNINTIERWVSAMLGIKVWKSSVYMFSKIPEQVDWAATGYIVLFAIIAAAVGAMLPALVAAGTRPVNILRYE